MIKVLVVEDDLAFRELLNEALILFDFNVTLAKHAEEAIEILDNKSFDIILTDITLGGKTGLELTRWYREINSFTPIVIISGHSDSETVKEALNSGINDYITKPFKITELPLIIQRNISKT